MSNVTFADLVDTSESRIQRMIGELNTLGYDQYELWGSNSVSKCKMWDSSNHKPVVTARGSYPELAMYRAVLIARAGGWEEYLDSVGLEHVEND